MRFKARVHAYARTHARARTHAHARTGHRLGRCLISRAQVMRFKARMLTSSRAQVMRFKARMLTSVRENDERDFVVSFFLDNDEIRRAGRGGYPTARAAQQTRSCLVGQIATQLFAPRICERLQCLCVCV